MNKKKLYITLGILSIIILSIGGTFAYYTTSMVATNITQIRAGNLTMTIDGGGDTNASFMPSKCTSEYAIKKKIVATSTNTSGGKVSFSIGMNVATLSDSLKTSTMKFALTTAEDSCTNGLIANGNFSNATVGSDIWMVKNDYDNITQTSNDYTKTYYLYIWLDEEETQNLSGSISVNMKGTSSNNPNLKTEVVSDKANTLYDYIESNADTTTQIDFNKTSEEDNTNGIYTTTNTDSGKPVYYYRGNVDNHVLFANLCWRIVRTTETGGVKLIYDGKPTNGQCNNTGEATTIGNSAFNSTYEDLKYAGYMYGSSIDDTANTNDSIIKTVVDNWYKTNMTSYTAQLEDTVFCNDRSYTKDDTGLNFGAASRQEYRKNNPTLKCQNMKDEFTTSTSNGNGALTYPVGLITADEIAYAGHSSDSGAGNSTIYLNVGISYWAMSPSFYLSSGIMNTPEVYVYYWDYMRYASAQWVNSSYGVRPSVSLQPGIAMTGGSGTATDPFVIG